MILKELHIRNIASIEKGDIDFANGLRDAITDENAALFLISGDTGSGKSVILDCIALALFRTTPRLGSVADTTKNKFTNSDGEEISIHNVNQYTRIGISHKDPCYTELKFEGNDGVEYSARLSLGLAKTYGKKNIIAHKKPKWELKTGNGDWEELKAADTRIMDIIGMNFDQFSKMAMLAQGQFATFLTGKKKEREEILEQLTNTSHFSKVGEAISNLLKNAKTECDLAKSEYETKRRDILSDIRKQELTDEIKSLSETEREQREQLRQLDAKIELIKKVNETRKAIGDTNSSLTQLQQQKESDAHRQDLTFVSDWDSTENVRQQLTRRNEATVTIGICNDDIGHIHDTYRALAANLEYREQRNLELRKQIQTAEHEFLLLSRNNTQIQKTDVIIERILSHTQNCARLQETQTDRKKAESSLETHKVASARASQKAEEIEKRVENMKSAIENIEKQREALRPEELSSAFNSHVSTRNKLDRLQYQLKDLAKTEHDLITANVTVAELNARMAGLVQSETDAKLQLESATNDYDSARSLLDTMQTSMTKAMIGIRKKIIDREIDTCPLCGQHISVIIQNEDFQEILRPIEARQQLAKIEYDKCTKLHTTLHDRIATLKGELSEKNKTLERLKKELHDQRESAMQACTTIFPELDIDIEAPDGLTKLEEIIGLRMEQLKVTIAETKDKIEESEKLLTDIGNLRTEELKIQADLKKAREECSKQQAKVAAVTSDIGHLSKTAQDLSDKTEADRQFIDDSVSDRYPDWEATASRTITELRNEKKHYDELVAKINADRQTMSGLTVLLDNLHSLNNAILNICPDWKEDFVPDEYCEGNVAESWHEVHGRLQSALRLREENKAVQRAAEERLNTYYSVSGHNETYLVGLIARKEDVDSCRKRINDLNSAIKSHTDALARLRSDLAGTLQLLQATDDQEIEDPDQLRTVRNETNNQLTACIAQISSKQTLIEQDDKHRTEFVAYEARLRQASAALAKWTRIDKVFGGTRFRTLVQTHILRPLLNNANLYLERITDQYRLICSEENQQLSILVQDRYNKNQIRSATILSGGEKFMISLALSLALSSLNRPDLNVDILFIDEGFGTLSENCLESVMNTLERLQDIAGQTGRRVGIISHREELRERIPVQINICPHGQGRSRIELLGTAD